MNKSKRYGLRYNNKHILDLYVSIYVVSYANKMDLISSLGELAVGSRLKRLSDLIMKDGQRIYQANGIEFQPKWFPVFYALSKNQPLSVTEIAAALGFAHPTISQTVKELERNGLAVSKPCPNDARKRELYLSRKGQDLIPRMEPVWRDISNALHRILSQNQSNLLQAMEEVEHRFEQKEFFDWVRDETKNRQLDEVTIVEYRAGLRDHFRDLNYEWIQKYFEIEEVDRHILEHPEKNILGKGGKVIFAQLEGKIVGTCALIKQQNKTFELCKMAVEQQARGRQVGKKLGLAAITLARELGANRIVLESNKKLVSALNLYETLGFREVQNPHQSIYCRANIKMELIIGNERD